jgi:L-fuculose-phosphate aldolase
MMIDERIYEIFREIGRDLYTADMVSSHGGNLSMRLGDRIIIKRRGAMLGNLKPHDLIETGLERNDSGVALASTELIVHRQIYKQTPALAICHCHPRTAIALSLSREEIVPIDNEGSYLLKKVPIIWEEFASGTPEMANKLAHALQNYKIVMLRGHGSFAIGQTLDEAFFWSSTLEEACQIILAAKAINEPFIEYRKMSDSYTKW